MHLEHSTLTSISESIHDNDTDSEWDLTTKTEVVAFVWDGGTDITKALNNSTFVPAPCSAHLLQCVVRKAFLENPFVQNQMIQDVSTRWNSTLHMMKQLNEQKDAIIMASSRKDETISAELTVDEWKKIEHLIDIMEIFDTATLQLRKETSSVSEVIPSMQVIQCHLEIPSPKGIGLQGLRNDLLVWLKQEFSFINTNELIAKATVLEPHFKMNPFQQEKHSVYLSSTEDSIVSEMEKISVTHGLSPAEKNSLIPSIYVTPYSHTTARDELNHYLNEPTINPEGNPKAVGQYWHDSEHRLKNVALKYLCVPSSTVSNERAFSTARAICNVREINLTLKERMLIFCHKNLQ
ncbi:hypothetical protein PR048_020760 [Dryococelus australis]|uniref:HAT C-terminal dimerisation domain-containing protein n=1 Tax=Dryococelus australis TaxID=614101 RepID=A0ABQ9GWB0_9NEOP|nr:hypothetical protein PR048_020760 [Dryococelus australis]